MSRTSLHHCYRGALSHLEVTLKSVEDDWLFSVEFSLHFQGQATNSRLEVRLLCVHHEPYSVLNGMLEDTDKKCLQQIQVRSDVVFLMSSSSP